MIKKTVLFFFFLFVAGILSGCKLSGRFTTDTGKPLEGIHISLTGDANKSTITNNNGEYSFEVADKFAGYIITPSFNNYPFTPGQRHVEIKSGTSSSGIGGIDFVVATDISVALVPKTGQTILYTNGDDGDLQRGVAVPGSRFTDHGNGTVTDNRSGLIWLKKANAPAKKRNWSTAIADVNELNSSGTMNSKYAGDTSNGGSHYKDWRLPNIKELQSLSDFGNYNPVLHNEQPFVDVQSFSYNDFYWSGTTPVSIYSGQAWNLSMLNGGIDKTGKQETGYVWPVRGGIFAETEAFIPKTGQTTSYADGDDGDLQSGATTDGPRFTDNGDGTVTDNLSLLIWLKKANASNSGRAWQNAFDDIEQLNANGTMNGQNCNDISNAGTHQTDWRLPNIKELQSLIDYSRSSPALPSGNPFTGVTADSCWSSTTCTWYDGSAWSVQMDFGNETGSEKSSLFLVWPVRSGD